MIQSRVSIQDMCDGIAETLRACPSVFAVQSYDQVTEAIPDTPLLQVLWDAHAVDVATTNDRTTFGAAVRHSEYQITVFAYAKQRANFNEDIKAAHQVMDEIDNVLEGETDCPPFGLVGCKGFRWEANRNLLNYAGVDYTGALITITLIFH